MSTSSGLEESVLSSWHELYARVSVQLLCVLPFSDQKFQINQS